ncbi:MAG: hypothetical protein J6A30_08160, partial [Ruminococcus sp.]|nr:hypothetical protein [Ruminococcus sp.]
MKIKAMRALTLTLALIMALSVISVSVMAAEEGYTPSLADMNQITFEGILKTNISDIGDYYLAYGQTANKFYTSLDGASWDYRTSTDSPALRSVAFGGAAGAEKGIGIKYKTLAAAHSPETYLFSRDMTAYKNYKETTVLPVYNKVKDESDIYIDLVPNIYYDSYSGLFFCYGLQYQDEKTSLAKNGTEYVKTTSNETDYLNLNLYYTNGAVTKSTYNGENANILTWTKVSGDFTSTYSFKRAYIGRLDTGRVLFDGDGQGNIAVIIGGANSNLDDNCFYNLSDSGTIHPRLCFSLVKIAKDGDAVSEVKSKFVNASAQMCDLKMTEDGKLLLWYNGKTATHYSLVYLHDVAGWWNSTVTKYSAKTVALSTREFSISSAKHNGSIYFLTDDCDVYRVKAEDITTTSSPAPQTVIDATVRTSLGISGTPKDIEFDKDGNMLLVMSDKIYKVELATDVSGDVSATKASALQADKTVNYVVNDGYSTDTTVRGYKIDIGTTLRGENTKSGAANFELVSGEEIYGGLYRYPTVNADTPCGSYDVT